MDGIAAEVGQKLKSAIKAKLMELGAYVDDELSNYVMVMVTNRRSKAEMDRELQLFLGGNTSVFTSWLQSVWQKLEQVTIANSGIEAHKRKLIEKKKKTKKTSKSSSESENDKKHRKKRKSSVSVSNCKDIKKLKRFDAMVDIKKVKRSNLNLHSETDSEDDEQAGNYASLAKKSTRGVSAGSSTDEDEFLNIKDDFESAFLSDVEFPETSNRSKTLVDHSKKPMVNVTVKRIKDSSTLGNRHVLNDENVDNNDVDEVASKINNAEVGHSVEIKANAVSKRKPLIRDFKAYSPPKAAKLYIHSGTSPPSKSRSRSSSSSRTDNLRSQRKHSASTEPGSGNESNIKSERSQLKPPTAIDSSLAVGSPSPRRSRSPLRNVNSKRMPIREEPPVLLDARELINRKRAASCMNSDFCSLKQGSLLKRLSHAADSSSNKAAHGGGGKQKNNLGIGKTTVSGGKIIRLRDLKRSKENCLVGSEESVIVEHDNEWNETDENAAGASATATLKELPTFIVNKSDDKRNVIVQSSAPTLDNTKIILREIKRTVFIEDGIDQKYDRNTAVNSEMGESIVSSDDEFQIKPIRKIRGADESIKSKRVVSSAVVKLQNPTRPKTLTAQSASSTLIRKAMADAHKSLSSKDEFHKKKELADAKGLSCQERSVANSHGYIAEDEETPHPEEAQCDDSYGRISSKSVSCSDDGSDDKSGEEENENKSDEQTMEAEEYDPSQNMPQFVVTLTGLDPKLYPVEDTDEIMDTLNDELDSIIENGIKSKPKMQERCKYYPNCLAGDQCLYYHPSIHCKLFPNCKYGNSCLYIHPKCKFDSMCTRYDCTFLHTTPRITAPVLTRHSAAPTTMSAQPCKFYYNCVNPVCPFQHPKICRFDRFCTNKNCTFSHTSLSHVSASSKGKLKWSRPKDTDTTERAPKPEKDTGMPINNCL